MITGMLFFAGCGQNKVPVEKVTGIVTIDNRPEKVLRSHFTPKTTIYGSCASINGTLHLFHLHASAPFMLAHDQ
jgi:hypothetical protein